MSGGLVDDYLSQLLGAAAEAGASPPAPVPAPAPAPPPVEETTVTASTPPPPTPPSNPDEISEDEFEALLDALHGGKPPGASTPAPVAPAPPPPPAAPANPDEISEDEFEALLDALHGGKPPGASTPAPVAPAPPPAAPANPDEITEDEFEALLDALHGGKPPGAASAPATPVAAAAAVAVAAAKASAPEGGRRAEDRGETPAEGGDWHGQERRASRRSSRWLRLHVHQQDYAVELLKVQEVLLPVPVLPMRDTSPAILGVMNLRGVVVPVLDLGLWLGLEEVQDSPQSRYVVLEQNGNCLALKVTAVLDVHAIADSDIEPAEHTLASPGSGMLSGVTRLNSQPVILLDAGGLLG